MGKQKEDFRPSGASHTIGHEEFRALWFDSWGFSDWGAPEDAALYLEGVLRAIANEEQYMPSIGSIEGQQQFMFQWLWANRLVERVEWMDRLTPLGARLLAGLDAGVHYEVFGLASPSVAP